LLATSNPEEVAVAKEELLEFEGVVTDVLPEGRYRVRLSNDHELIVYTAGRMKRNKIKTLTGDRVTVEVSPYDFSKGRMTFRHKGQSESGERRPVHRKFGSRK
jgi:translation initiation factor IF-1